ncbi:hypothetical protein SELMODRAFT_228128 [Selaginella moellendorffii]|uniref:Protein farnesyltransferase/geranylgeranyltransferase type-1 subunit alpha n=1 Tax=Selaginella moellendorffii TaxID=88036 RepID=D8RND4_SELML|nr:protein farnesyltransferase/geranylgeranyltransferase type-1 subunit alpha [Selaginella moellendorffii]EFJ26706.1 hypothetical protein SELMODRAFT_228128 [Selaginella moellendorffii]|eukprot:XP_024533317.1 protein farnesyltransferase/geranylgeranyltransferase type-1 subunit alpha [Selaginella moellendorffii]
MSSDDDEEVWIPLREREEWKDVEPIPQDDGPNPVVPIAYTSQFREVMDYFRAVVARDERSARALNLTGEVIALNPGNYTVWHFRRLVLESIEGDLDKEMDFIENMAEDNAKNYQIWHHRRWLAEKRGPACMNAELEFTANILSEDGKNYHAWSHRQWVLEKLGGWEKELEFLVQMLQEDVYNNSVWNQRFFVITNSPAIGGLVAAKDSELKFCCDAIRFAPDNESAWRYLGGLFKDDKSALVRSPEVIRVCIEELAKDKISVHALNFLLDLLCRGYRPTADDCRLLDFPSEGLSPEQLARQVCERLEVADSMRRNYWAWRKSLLKKANS